MDYSQGAESNLFHQVMNRAVRKPNFQKGSAPSNSCWKQSCRENPATSWPCLSKSWQFWKPALGFPTCILCTVPYTHQARQLHALPWMSFICRVTKTTCGTSRCSWGEYKEKSLYPSFLPFCFFFPKLPRWGNAALSRQAEGWQGGSSKTRRTDCGFNKAVRADI